MTSTLLPPRRKINENGQSARLSPWHSHAHRGQLIILGNLARNNSQFVEHCLMRARLDGYNEVLSGALQPHEQIPFLEAGFRPLEELYVLGRDTRNINLAIKHSLRRTNKKDIRRVLEIDSQCFNEFWTMDDIGLTEATSATPRCRFRVAVQHGDVVGYAITGRSRKAGYVQRIGVAPEFRKSGVASSLLADSITWLHNRLCKEVLVNTQLDNHAALSLYKKAGFTLEPYRLAVLLWRDGF